jgi:hypothetical protein
LTIDVSDRVSLYGGVSASSTHTDLTDWSAFAVNSRNVGFQADIYQQDGGSIPTITLQSTVTRAVPNGPLATTSFNNILEFNYAFDEDETRGLLAGVQYTRVDIESRLHGSIQTSSAISAVTINGPTTGRFPAASVCNRSAARSFST